MTRERRRRIIRTRRTAIGMSLVVTISFLAGMTDAAGLLVAGSFVSFMSGNTTRAAVSLADGEMSYAAVLFGALAIFVAGNALGIIIAHNAARRAFRVLTAVTLALTCAAAITDPAFVTLRFYALVLAMGLVNTAVEHIEGLPIGLTYVTGALSRFGRGIGHWVVGNPRRDWIIQIAPLDRHGNRRHLRCLSRTNARCRCPLADLCPRCRPRGPRFPDTAPLAEKTRAASATPGQTSQAPNVLTRFTSKGMRKR